MQVHKVHIQKKFTLYYFRIYIVTPQIRLTSEPNWNIKGHPLKSINPDLTGMNLLLAR